MKSRLIIFALSTLLPAEQLLAMEVQRDAGLKLLRSPTIVAMMPSHDSRSSSLLRQAEPARSYPLPQNSTFLLQEDGLTGECADELVAGLSSKTENSLINYGHATSPEAKSKFCLEQKNARLEEARQTFLNALTPIYLLKQQATDLYERVATPATGSPANRAPRGDILEHIKSYPERAKHLKIRLTEVIAEVNSLGNDITMSFARYQSTSQNLAQGLQGKNLDTLAASQHDLEAKMLEARRDVQTAKEIFELLELRLKVSSEFIAMMGEEEKKNLNRLVSQGGGDAGFADNEKILAALFLLDAVGKRLPGASSSSPSYLVAQRHAQPAAQHIAEKTASSDAKAAPRDEQKPAPQAEKPTVASEPQIASIAQGPAPEQKNATEPEPADKVVNQEIEALLQRWARAWRSQDLTAYLECYGEGFTPAGGKTREKWQAERAERLSKPKFIQVDIKTLRVTPGKDGIWRIDIEQRYASDIFRDHIAKALHLRRDSQGLRIAKEESLGKLQGN